MLSILDWMSFCVRSKLGGGKKNETHYRRQESQTIAEDPKRVNARDAGEAGRRAEENSEAEKA